MKQLIFLSTLCITLSGPYSLPAHAEVDFVKEIQPIFKKRCYECHGNETQEAGLRLDQKADALAGGDSGQIIKPNKASESLLIKLVSGEDSDRVMPPDGENLTPEEITKIETWIDEGAHWPDGIDPKKERSKHWAYQPLSGPLPSDTTLSGHQPLDQFILAGLKSKKITPNPIADRYTLIKRLYYDLIGLPPSIEDVEAFVNDQSEDSYEKLVDQLLASDHFGERWGRHWLDMARYADSDGYEKDRPRYNAWKYRDWVINSINADMPFDQFTVEQIAGDQIENPSPDQLLATAFHRQTLTNTEGGTDQEEFRVAAVFDRVETIGAVWLGLTVGCARCHSHKYDQISQREYYQLFAFFNNGDETTTKLASSEQALKEYQTKKKAYDAQLKKLQAPVEKRRNELKPGFDAWMAELQRKYEAEGLEQKTVTLNNDRVDSKTGTLQKQADGTVIAVRDQETQDTYELTFSSPTSDPFEISGIRLDVLTDDSFPKNGPGRSSGGNFVLSEITADIVAENGETLRRKFQSASADFSQKGFEVAQAIDGDETIKGWAISPQTGKPHTATFNFEKPISADELSKSKLLIRLSQQYSSSLHTLGKFRISFLAASGAELVALPENIKKILPLEPAKREKKQLDELLSYFVSLDPEFKKLSGRVAAHQKTAPFNPEMVVRVVQTREKDPRETHILKRGDFLQPLGPVVPDTLEILPELQAAVEGNPTRIEFAKWLISGENPLPPRVFVNQVWSHLFGRGLVQTVNDFGIRGEPPTHPELLDWLSIQFIESGWSRKQLIKLIVLSETYRRSSVHRPELADIDPTNKLLYRQNRFRVEAEIIRDLYLSASGLLEPRIGGPSVFPPLPPDIAAVSYANNFKWGNSDWNSRPDRPHGVAPKDDIYRRGIYTFFKRTAAHPNLITFDCPDSNTTSVERNASNTPLQALQTLNNNVFLDAARAMAGRILNDSSLSTDQERLSKLFRLTVTRLPTPEELTVLNGLLRDSNAYYEKSPEEAVALANVEEKSEAQQKAAWIAVSRMVLNLDEFITRE